MSYIGRGLPNLRSNAEFSYTASAGQTLFVVPITYTPGNISVFHNGRRVGGFTATDGATVLLNSAATLGDEIVIIVQSNFAVVGAYTKTENDGLFAKKDGSNMATPPQFDNDLSLATTAFVRRALGSRSGELLITTDTSLVAADIGKLIKSINTVAISVFLPPLSGNPGSAPGSSISITNSGTSQLFVVANGADALRRQNDVVASIAVQPGSTITLTAVSNSWEALTDDAILSSSPMFSASLATNGYQKLPSGLIIQWGITTPTTGGAATTFPLAFPNIVNSIQMVAASGVHIWASPGGSPKTGFVAWSAATSAGTYWEAIGY